MSKIKNAIDNFLDSGGEHIGYSENDLPDLSDIPTCLLYTSPSTRDKRVYRMTYST